MPANTPVYGFPYPLSTDLVANYPALGQELAEDIEAVLPTLGGISLIAPTTTANSGGTVTVTNGAVAFSAVTSVSLNGVFTGTRANYRIAINITSATVGAQNLSMRLRAAGTDNTSSLYGNSQIFNVFSGTTITANNNAATGTTWMVHFLDTGSGSRMVDLMAPQLAARTHMQSNGGNLDSWSITVGTHNSTTQFDGFSLYVGSGNVTGTVRVYGYRN